MTKLNTILPESVTLGNLTYDVEQKSPVMVDSERCAGAIFYLEQKIVLDKHYSMPEKVNILWHEMTHWILRKSGVAHLLDEKMIEALCDSLGFALGELMWSGQIVFRGDTDEVLDKPKAP